MANGDFINKTNSMNANESIFQQLRDYFNNTPEEELRREWKEFDKYNNIGPTIEEWLNEVSQISPEHQAVIEKYKKEKP